MQKSCVALICVRNESLHIHRMISDFTNQGIEVVIIDNGSTDDTLDICSTFLGKGLLFVKNMPWTGKFNLSKNLEIKEQVAKTLRHDWIIHADADEWMHSSVDGESLIDGITRISESGFNVINFEEFVFLPKSDSQYNIHDYNKEFKDYYYFAPQKHRLMRAWNRLQDFRNLASGGHRLNGKNINIAPESFILRHYIVLSYEHAVEKYTRRVFSECDLAKGWHGNRLNLTAKKLKLPDRNKLKRLDRWDNYNLDNSDPKDSHYWEWNQ